MFVCTHTSALLYFFMLEQVDWRLMLTSILVLRELYTPTLSRLPRPHSMHIIRTRKADFSITQRFLNRLITQLLTSF